MNSEIIQQSTILLRKSLEKLGKNLNKKSLDMGLGLKTRSIEWMKDSEQIYRFVRII